MHTCRLNSRRSVAQPHALSPVTGFLHVVLHLTPMGASSPFELVLDVLGHLCSTS